MKLFEKIPSINKNSTTWFSLTRSTFGDSRGVQLLSGVLVVQLAVAGGLLWRSNAQATFIPAEHLVSVDATIVNEIFIDDGEESVTLTLADDQWRMNDEYETLASADKINQLINRISGLKPGLPVASMQGSHNQLEVAEDSYQRRITLKAADETVADLYMGTSPGFKKSHVRQAGQDQVYAAKLNTFDVPADQDDWLDENLLAFDNVSGVKSGDTELSYVDDQWSIAHPSDQLATHEVDEVAMTSLVSTLESIRVNGLATQLIADDPADTTMAKDESEASESEDEVEELLTHSVEIVQNDSPVTLTLSKKGSDATIARSDVEGLFALPIATYDKLTADAIKQIVIEKTDEEPEDGQQPQG